MEKIQFWLRVFVKVLVLVSGILFYYLDKLDAEYHSPEKVMFKNVPYTYTVWERVALPFVDDSAHLTQRVKKEYLGHNPVLDVRPSQLLGRDDSQNRYLYLDAQIQKTDSILVRADTPDSVLVVIIKEESRKHTKGRIKTQW